MTILLSSCSSFIVFLKIRPLRCFFVGKKKKKMNVSKASRLLSIVLIACYVAGILMLLSWSAVHRREPFGAKSTYVSENALMPHTSDALYSTRNVDIAIEVSSSIGSLEDVRSSFQVLLGAAALSSSSSSSSSSLVHSLISSPRGDGSEALLLAAKLYSRSSIGKIENDSVCSVGFLLSLVDLLREARWLSRDVVVVVYEHDDDAVRWIDDYVLHGNGTGGYLRGAVVLDFAPMRGADVDAVTLLYEGEHSALPNMDLINVIARLHRRGSASLETRHAEPSSPLAELAERMAAHANAAVAALPTALLFGGPPPGVSASLLNSVLSFMRGQALNEPSGRVHARLNRYHIDSVTLQPRRKQAPRQKPKQANDKLAFVDLGATVERTVRCLSNIVEHLHQSFYYYLLPAPGIYVSIGTYMIAFGLVAASLPVELLWRVYVAPPPSLWDARIILATVCVYAACAAASLVAAPLHVCAALGLVGAPLLRHFAALSANSKALRIFSLAPLVVGVVGASLVNFSLAYCWALLAVPAFVVPWHCAPWPLRALAWLATSPCAIIAALGGIDHMPLLCTLYLPAHILFAQL
jgi:GPI-anchor transamidase subunit GAA1